MKRPYTIGLVCARGGSKGVPRKNLRKLGGKPLIGWAIEVARQCPSLERVVVSTEDQEIADVARSFGAEVPFMRPAELARDDSPELLAWKHCLRSLTELEGRTPDFLVTVPATSPLRAVEDVERCYAYLLERQADMCITIREPQRNPYFNVVKIEDGWVSVAVKPPKPIVRRQEAPPVFDMTTVAFAARAQYVLETNHLYDGKVCATMVPDERSLDIDTEMEFEFGEFLLRRKNGRSQSV